MKKKAVLFAVTCAFVTVFSVAKTYALAEQGPTITLCTGSPEVCKVSFTSSDGRTWSLDSVKSKDSSSVIIS